MQRPLLFSRYTFLATSVKVHAIPDKAQAKGFELKAGMQIRFNSSIDLFSKQNQVREILATNMIDQHRLHTQ